MGIFNNAITDVGRLLLTDVQAGAVFTPTRIVLGSGSVPSGTLAEEMTDVVAPVTVLEINKKVRTADGKCIFGGVYTNAAITEPFYFRELALYAKAVYLNDDGTVKSEGEETLYSYGNAGETADLMAAYSASTLVERQMDLVVWVGNNVQVNLTVESGMFLTREEAILNTEQELSDEKKARARANIRAMEIPTRTSWVNKHIRTVPYDAFVEQNNWFVYEVGEKQERITNENDFYFRAYQDDVAFYPPDCDICDIGTDGYHVWEAKFIDAAGSSWFVRIGNGQHPVTMEVTNKLILAVSKRLRLYFYYRQLNVADAAVVTSINGVTPDANGDVQLDSLPPARALTYDAQTLDDIQKRQARQNIGAVSIEEVVQQLSATIIPEIVERVRFGLEGGIVLTDTKNAAQSYLVSVEDGKLQMTREEA